MRFQLKHPSRLTLFFSALFLVVQLLYLLDNHSNSSFTSICVSNNKTAECCTHCSENETKHHDDCSVSCNCCSQSPVAQQVNLQANPDFLEYQTKTTNFYKKEYSFLFEFDIDKPPNALIVV